MQDAEHNQAVILDAEVSAILAERVHAQAWPEPIAGNAGNAEASGAVEVGDEPGDEPLGGLRTICRNIIVDAVEIGAGRISDDEFAALDDCDLLERVAV